MSPPLHEALAEVVRRRAGKAEERYPAICKAIRDELHPKQLAAVTSDADQLAMLCTRRSGKSKGGIGAMLCTALEEPNSHQVYINETRKETKRIAWRGAHGKDGFIPLLARYGLTRECRTNETELTLTFRNGSVIELFGADDEAQMDKLRGGAYRRAWVDEAQKIRALREFIEDVLQPAMRDQVMITGKAGQLWLTGTPSEDTAGYFYDVTNEEAPMAGWEVHRWGVTDNPFFGLTVDERWKNTAGAILAKNKWTGEEPKFQREWLARWVKTDARYVYSVHRVPEHALVYAPMRMTADGGYDHAAAFLDLPRRPVKDVYGDPFRRWHFVAGVDLGYSPSPMAVVLWAYSMDLPDIYELWSWKQTGLIPDAQAKVLQDLRKRVRLSSLVGDPGGLGKAMLEGWRERYNLPIDDAEKTQKRTWQELLNNDIETGRVHFRAGSPLLYEMHNLMWAPVSKRVLARANGTVPMEEWAGRMLKDKSKPGNHCCDAGLYSYRQLYHYLHKDEPQDPKPGSPGWAAHVERQIEEEIDEWDPDYAA